MLLISLRSPYALLKTLSSDPLLLSVVAHLCTKHHEYTTGIQMALVGLSYLDLDRPASMALPRFHAFCWCAVGKVIKYQNSEMKRERARIWKAM